MVPSVVEQATCGAFADETLEVNVSRRDPNAVELTIQRGAALWNRAEKCFE
jgi:hypothetical protein